MAIFFLHVGLEIKKEILEGSLSSFKKASFPVIASLGGVIVPAIIFMIINKNTKYLPGVGVAISTDIAFAIGIFMIFKDRMNSNLKIAPVLKNIDEENLPKNVLFLKTKRTSW